MALNFTLQDAIGILESIPAFAIFLFTPGYCLGQITDVLRFRGRSNTEKVLLSLPLSLVLSTVVANLLGRYVPAAVLSCVFVLSAAWVLFSLARQSFRNRTKTFLLHRTTKIAIWLAVVWAMVVVASLVDIQWGGKLYVTTAIWDHAVRIAFLRSAIRSGPPPVNPFCYLGSAPTARYYYYWYVLCSYPARLFHLDARYVLYGSSVWAGFCLAATIPLYLKNFSGITENLRWKSICGIALISITGLDLIPNAYEFLRARMVFPDMEWWDPVQVTSWMDALIWVPHHVASLVACLIGLLALCGVRQSERATAPTLLSRIVAGVFAAASFAAAAGLSVYVTFTFAIFLCCWSLRLLYKRYFSDFFLYLWTGCLTIFISLPYLHDLLSSGEVMGAPATAGVSLSGTSARAIQFGLRQLPNFLSMPYFLKMRGFSHPLLLYPFGLVAVYLLEFGFLAVIGCIRLRRDLRDRIRLHEAEIACWYLLATSFLVMTFVRSSVISNNDLAFRSAMIAQFILLLWSAEYLDGWRGFAGRRGSRSWTAKNAVLVSTVILGALGTIYGLAILRTYTILDDRGWIAQPAPWLPMPPNMGEKLFDTREAYRELDRLVPFHSIVQYNPISGDYLALLLYSRFQSVDAFPDCGTEFGGSAKACMPVQTALIHLFNVRGTYDLDQLCHRLSIDVLVAHESDPAWKDRSSWIWTNPPIVDNSYIRAFRCR